MTDYTPLLTAPEGDKATKVYLDPADAAKLVTRIRKVSFFMRVDMPLMTAFDDDGKPTRCYDINESIKVSAAQVHKVLEAKVRFNKLKAEKDATAPAGLIEVTRLGHCIFLG